MRVLTRSDFDGLASCVLLKKVGIADDFKFIHPKDMQDGAVKVTSNDILANVPYVKGCGMWFDHHASEQDRNEGAEDVEGDFRLAPSAARVIYDYYGGDEKLGDVKEFVEYVDKSDSAQFDSAEILEPEGWILLSFVMDPRTGLGRYKDYRISNYDLMMKMIDMCATMSADEILNDPDVLERVDRYIQQDKLFREMIGKHSKTDENVITTDLRGVPEIYSGNRFLVYAMYPEQNISVWLVDGKDKQNTVFAVGHSIINRTSNTNVGALMLRYGGGGHAQVGTCQVANGKADMTLSDLAEQMKTDG